MIIIIYMFVVSLAISLSITPLVIYASNVFKLYDVPGVCRGDDNQIRKKTHLLPTSRFGGFSIFISFLVAAFLNANNYPYLIIYGSMSLFYLVGFMDDIKPISSKFRLLVQVLFSIILIHKSGLYMTSINTLGSNIELGIVGGYIMSLFIIIGAVNSLNMIDGMDGLAAGVTLIGIAMLSFLHIYVTNNLSILTIFTVALSGAIIGFLKYNTYPARIFMGDGGSNWLGCLMGTMLIITLGGFDLSEHSVPLLSKHNLVPLISGALCLAIPICDTAAVIVHRLLNRRNPLQADNSHLHHVLFRMGFEQNQIVLIIYFLSFALCVFGIFPVVYSNYNLAWLSYLAFISFFVLNLVSKSDFMIKITTNINTHQSGKIKSPPSRYTKFLKIWETSNRYFIYVILCITPFFSGVTPPTLGMAASYFIPILTVSLFVKPKQSDFLQSMILAIASCVILVSVNANLLIVQINGKILQVQWIYNYVFIVLGISASSFILFSFSRKHLTITPTDFLLLSIPLVFLIVPEPWQTQYRLGVISARALVIFLALRTFVMGHLSGIRRVKLLLLMSISYIAANGILGFRFVY